jgi:hypothetical protein
VRSLILCVGFRPLVRLTRPLRRRLIKCTVEMMRCRLDRLYLEGLSSSARPRSGSKNAAAVRELQEELDSLYSELLPVAQMSVENQHLEPALRRLTKRNRESLGHATAAVEYVSSCPMEVPPCALC